jgi:hypothetical protein
VYSSWATSCEFLPDKTTRKCSTRGCCDTNAYAISHICGTVGCSAVQETVTKGDLRARAQELLSPFDGPASSATKAISLNDTASLCNSVGGEMPGLPEDVVEGKI